VVRVANGNAAGPQFQLPVHAVAVMEFVNIDNL